MSTTTRLIAAASLMALLSAPAFAQDTGDRTVLNTQIQWGDISSDMVIVATQNIADGVTAQSAAIGNTASGVNKDGDFNVTTTQEMYGAANATASIDAQNACCHAVSQAMAQGNSVQGGAHNGDLNLLGAQTTAGGDIQAVARANIGSTSFMSVASAAAANDAVTGVENGNVNTRFTQDSTVSIRARTDADACCTGASIVSSMAAANTFSSSSTNGTVDANITQTSTGETVQASTDLYQYRAFEAAAASNAAGNSIEVAGKFGESHVTTDQENQSTVSAETYQTLGTWDGAALTSAYGVGNTTLATNAGANLTGASNQYNNGAINVVASFNGGVSEASTGGATLNATAIGNAYTGWVCALCGDASYAGTVSQSNGGNVTSTGILRSNSTGYLTGTAIAVGNSSTFVTQSGN